MRRIVAVAAVVAAVLATVAGTSRAQVEMPKLTLAGAGERLYIYLPLTLAQQIGYFKDAGVDVDIVDVAGGSKALEALLGASASVVCGFIDHTIEMQAQGKSIKMFVRYDRYPGLVMALTKAGQSKGMKGIGDLRNAKVGVTAPVSSTHFFAQYLLTRNGVPPDSASYIGIGTAATAVAAARRRRRPRQRRPHDDDPDEERRHPNPG